MSLTKTGIAEMLCGYERDCHTGMDIEYIARQLYEYTSGYPFLVSRYGNSTDKFIEEYGRLLFLL